MLKKTTIVIVALVFAMTVSVFLYRHRTATQSYSNEEISGSALNAPPQTSETQTVAVSEYNQPSTTSPPQLPDNLIASTPYDPIAPIAFEPASTSPDEIRATLLNDPVLLELKPEKLEELVQGMVLLGESYNAIRSRYNVETIEGYRQMLVDDANANIEGRDGQFYAARLERFDSLTDSEKERTVYLRYENDYYDSNKTVRAVTVLCPADERPILYMQL